MHARTRVRAHTHTHTPIVSTSSTSALVDTFDLLATWLDKAVFEMFILFRPVVSLYTAKPTRCEKQMIYVRACTYVKVS